MREESVSAMFMDIAEIKDMMQSMQSALTDNEIDWEARRYEIAKSVMQAIVANSHDKHYSRNIPELGCRKKFDCYEMAEHAVFYADALIDELKKKGE
jgi:hypothetical protein